MEGERKTRYIMEEIELGKEKRQNGRVKIGVK